MAEMGKWVDNRWIWKVKLADGSELQEEEGEELDSLLIMLHEVQVKPFEEGVFVWWRNKLNFSIKMCY